MADDDELDELLDSALNDFDKPATPSAKKVNQSANPDDNKAIDVSSTTDSGEVNQPSEDELSKIFAESFAEAAVDLEEAMKKMGGGQDADFMAHLSHLANSAKQAASKENPEAMNAFEDNLAKTMNEMAQNAKDLENPDAFGDDLVKAMSSMGLDGGDGMDMMPLMQGMMKNLLAKDILYPSLKELHDKYPAWLEEHKSSNSDEQHARFTKQHELVGQLCHEYEKENPDDSDEVLKARFETIMDLMQKMQECGQPPEELVGKMGAGAPFGPGCMPGIPDMSPDLPNECNPS